MNAVLIGAPLSVLPVWQAEFAKWAPEVAVYLYHGSTTEREKALRRAQTRGGVLLTTHVSRGLAVLRVEERGTHPPTRALALALASGRLQDMIRINAVALGATAEAAAEGTHGAVPWMPVDARPEGAVVWDYVILDE